MISTSSKKVNLSSESLKTKYVQPFYSRVLALNLELLFTLLIGGIFLAIYFLSDDIILGELSKAMMAIALLCVFRFIKPNSNNL